MSSAEITYMDIELAVEYDFEAGEEPSRFEPGCSDEAIITSVCVGDVDVTNIIGADHLERIAERVASDHDNDAAAHHADYLIKQLKELA